MESNGADESVGTMDEPLPGLGPLETAVLDLLWADEEPMSVRTVVDSLPDRTPAYTTISTVLENLRRKGWVERDRVGRLWFYRPLRDRPTYAAERMSGVLADSGDPRATLLRFVDDMPADQVEVLRDLLSDVPREEEP